MKARIPISKTNKKDSPGHRAKERLSAFPFLYKIARALYRLLRYLWWRGQCQVRKLGNNFKFDRIYTVRTDDILLCTEKEHDPYSDDGLRLDGDWDLSTKEFSDLNVFIAFTDHFLRKMDWEDTQYFKNTLQKIKEGYVPWDCTSELDLKKRCAGFDRLYREIEKEGYKKQTELRHSFNYISILDEISVNLDRNGNLLFNDGAHRLSIAKILGIKTVPVRITVCHARCSNFEKLHLTDTN